MKKKTRNQNIDPMTGRKKLSLSELQLASSGKLPAQQEPFVKPVFRPVHGPECCCNYCDPCERFPDFPELS